MNGLRIGVLTLALLATPLLAFTTYMPVKLDADRVSRMSVSELEQLVSEMYQDLASCEWILQDPTSELDWDARLKAYHACVAAGKENLLLVKKELNKKLKNVKTDDPDRKRLKKAQSQVQGMISEAQKSSKKHKATGKAEQRSD